MPNVETLAGRTIMTLFRAPGTEIWTYRFFISGRKHQKSTRVRDKREAARIEGAAYREAERKALLKTPEATSITVEEGMRRLKKKKKGQQRCAVSYLRNFNRFCDKIAEWVGSLPVADIDAATIRDLIERRSREGKDGKLSASEIRSSIINPMSQLLRTAHKEWKVPMTAIDWGELKPKLPPGRRRTLKFEEEACFADSPFFPCLQFARLSALRFRNFVNLTWDQVDFTNEQITVVQKRGTLHTIPMDSAMRAIIQAQRGKHPKYVFTAPLLRRQGDTLKGELGRITDHRFKKWFSSVCSRHGLIDLRIHDLRRTGGMDFYRATKDIYATSKLMGHASVQTTTLAYAEVLADELKDQKEMASRKVSSARSKTTANGATPTTQQGKSGQSTRVIEAVRRYQKPKQRRPRWRRKGPARSGRSN